MDWLALWREIVTRREATRDETVVDDAWRERARAYDARVKQRWLRPDSSRDTVMALLRAHPDWTVLDIGGGTGAWALLMAHHARQVTVVEPSPAMRAVLEENIAAEGAGNVQVVPAAWPVEGLPPVDLVFCAHAMYAQPDWAQFVGQIVALARHRVVLVMRASLPDGLLSEAAWKVLGHPYAGASFQVAHNALMQMGIFADVIMEESGLWAPTRSLSPEAALNEVRRRLGLSGPGPHDAYLCDLIARRLTREGDFYVWPRDTRSALLLWDVTRSGARTPLE